MGGALGGRLETLYSSKEFGPRLAARIAAWAALTNSFQGLADTLAGHPNPATHLGITKTEIMQTAYQPVLLKRASMRFVIKAALAMAAIRIVHIPSVDQLSNIESMHMAKT